MLEAYFVRHKLLAGPKILERLWTEGLVALHYADNMSTRPQDYERSGEVALTRLHEAAKHGAVVGAEYRAFRQGSIRVGRIDAGSKVEAEAFVDASSGRTSIYKFVRMTAVKEVRYLDAPALAGLRPQQATITKWPSARVLLNAITNNLPLPVEVTTLDPAQLEVLCFEYLRMKGILSRLLAPIGRTMIDVDILGLDFAGRRVAAQVTHQQNPALVQAKVAALKAHAAVGMRLVMFAPKGTVTDASVEHVPIEDAFATLLGDVEGHGKAMVAEMLGQRRLP
ncbi:MAG: hypothetical protein HYS27_23055 [Deltaproteobacteria bacterium]|nr:hypothetical protein [Deltaproteobacteria bacterium]